MPFREKGCITCNCFLNDEVNVCGYLMFRTSRIYMHLVTSTRTVQHVSHLCSWYIYAMQSGEQSAIDDRNPKHHLSALISPIFPTTPSNSFTLSFHPFHICSSLFSISSFSFSISSNSFINVILCPSFNL